MESDGLKPQRITADRKLPEVKVFQDVLLKIYIILKNRILKIQHILEIH